MVQKHGHKWMKSYRKLISIQISYLKYSGFGSIDSRSSVLLNSAYFAYKIWILTTMYIFAITVFADIYVNRGDLSISTDDGCIFAGIFVIIYKAMNFQFREKDIRKLLDDILKCIDNLCEFSEVEYIQELIDKYYKRQRILFIGFSVLGFTLATVLLLFSPMENGLPIRAQYPFNTTASPSHEIGFAIETCAISGGLLGLIGLDSTSSVICVLLTQLFDMLNINFEHCTNETNENPANIHDEHISTNIRYDERKSNNMFLRRYKICLQFHQRSISMCNDYNKLFSISMFVQMLSSTSIICLTGFQAIVVGGQNSDIIKFGIYLGAGVSQLFYICWIGNELSYTSSTLDRSQWLSGWHNECLTNIVRMFTLSTMFTRQSITIKASVFYVLSLETFITIIKGSYSIFALLDNIHATSR